MNVEKPGSQSVNRYRMMKKKLTDLGVYEIGMGLEEMTCIAKACDIDMSNDKFSTSATAGSTSSLPKKDRSYSYKLVGAIMKRKLSEHGMYENKMTTEQMKQLLHIKRVKKFESTENTIYDRMSEILKTGKFSDVILDIRGTELKAYKMALSVQSPVFLAMFDNQQMKEAKENRVVIEDIDIEVAKQMLEFVNTNDKPSGIDEYALDLLSVAHKYEMTRLKLLCEKSLVENINVNNAIKCLVHANTYGSETFIKAIVEFMSLNPSLLISDEFKRLKEKDPMFSIKIYADVLESIGLTEL
ncbi:hypothetical protein HCN44_010753 [Aphidius gifuensis]|uniref:BTB domain-containing protein n=1 Tax=Aphidius gifuensis TaxID=684658 RepID=A0A835CQ68_APHGI|nr:protein roadkill-like [Aphidius gifuensis]KAF7991952.1 hypothetical protein HCN44_010753 [Aphidius gifuensis]